MYFVVDNTIYNLKLFCVSRKNNSAVYLYNATMDRCRRNRINTVNNK